MMASQFSRDGKYFAQLSTEGKLKIWATATSTFEQEFTPDFHLTSPCTCLHFVDVGAPTNKSTSPRKKKRRESQDFSTPYVTLGTSSGLLLVYSIAKAELQFSINSETSQSISCLSWCDGNIVYSAAEQDVLCWNLEKKVVKSKWKAGNEKISAILVIPDGSKILTASRNIKVWNLESKQILQTFTGHSYEISILQYLKPCGRSDSYIISGSKGDRLLSCWSMSEQTSERNSIASLLMEDIPYDVSVTTCTDGSTRMAVITRSGVVHVYRHTLNGKCAKPLKPKTTIQIASDTGQNDSLVASIPIVAAFLREDVSLLIGHGTPILLTFENLVLNEYEKVQCLIRQDPRIASKSTENKVLKTQTPIVDNNVHYLTPHSSTSTIKRRNDGTQEVPMEKRLENLALNKLDCDSKVPKADNVSQLLIQGLHSKDKKILRSVLENRDETVIRNTVRRLPMPVIEPLVQELTTFIQGKTLWSHIGATWLRHLVQAHAGILLSNPKLSELLGPVVGSIENRLSLLTPLNRLRGRLDLLATQVGAATSHENNSIEDALLIYDDKDSSDSESEGMMDMAAHSESDNEWFEEGSEGDVEENNEQDDSDVEMFT